jgi:hypothetical protein
MSEEPRKEDVKELINALKDAVVELKSLVLEAENPFREKPIVKKVKIEETAASKQSTAEKAIEKPSLASEKMIGEPTPAQLQEAPQKILHESIAKPPSSAAVASVSPQEEELSSIKEAVREIRSGTLSFRKILKLTNLFFNINKPVLQDNLPKIIRLLELTGYIGDVEAELLRLLSDLASDSKKFKVRPEDNVIIAYMIAKTLGIEDKEFENDLLDVLYKIVIGGRGEGVSGWENQQ